MPRPRVDVLELGRLGGRVEAPAADAGDVLQRLGVGRDADALGEAEGVLHLDLAVGGAEGDRVDRDLVLLGALRHLERVDAALGVLAVGEQDEHGGQPAGPGAVRVGDGRARRLQSALEAEPHRGAADRGQLVEGALHARAVGGRRGALLGEVGERHEPEPERLRELVGELVGGAHGGRDPVGLDVGGVHRARDVGDHHHRRRPLRRGDRALRPRERDHHRGEREQQQQRREVPAPAGARRDEVRHQRGVGEAGRLGRAAALEGHVHQQPERDEHEPEQDRGLREAHPDVPLLEVRNRAAAAERVGAPARSAASPRRRCAARPRSQSPSVDSTT